MSGDSYAPIAYVKFCARPRIDYYGAYPLGFLKPARDLLGCRLTDVVLHVCAGKVHEYPYYGVGPLDVTMDLDPAVHPDIVGDARQIKPYADARDVHGILDGILADPAYSREEQANYGDGSPAWQDQWPSPATIVRNSIEILPVGGRVGVLSYELPRYPKDKARQVAVMAVYVGNGNMGRTFAVFERTA